MISWLISCSFFCPFFLFCVFILRCFYQFIQSCNPLQVADRITMILKE
jgi:hypothetical protein